MPDIGNEYWTPSLNLTWRPKKDLFTREVCSCKIHSAFDIYGDEDRCTKCSGLGYILKPIDAPKPEWPSDYAAYMRRCHDLYIKRTRKFRG